MKTRNEAREIERAIARLVADTRESLESEEKLARMKAMMAEAGITMPLTPEEQALRGVLAGLITARNEVRNEFLRGPRRRIKR